MRIVLSLLALTMFLALVVSGCELEVSTSGAIGTSPSGPTADDEPASVSSSPVCAQDAGPDGGER